ncbi:transposase [Parendozoicomonas sp. Alg238-R29]|uniref:IS110 family transposase n=1 Tax=Parendozoicomonas sp. Alg238-R29 TaxID=2993446 RepID=UPI00248DDCF8|nr:transposase [Parendozoicomonas sp. Alg238-R29]
MSDDSEEANHHKYYGHEAKLLPPQYVKPYVKTNKNDFTDADAIAEAATRPSMRFVSMKSEQTQAIAALHRRRNGYVKDRKGWMSRIGAILLEFDAALPQGHAAMKKLFVWLDNKCAVLPSLLKAELHCCHEHYLLLSARIPELDKTPKKLVEDNAQRQNLKTIPGVGDIVASLCLAHVGAASSRGFVSPVRFLLSEMPGHEAIMLFQENWPAKR